MFRVMFFLVVAISNNSFAIDKGSMEESGIHESRVGGFDQNYVFSPMEFVPIYVEQDPNEKIFGHHETLVLNKCFDPDSNEKFGDFFAEVLKQFTENVNYTADQVIQKIRKTNQDLIPKKPNEDNYADAYLRLIVMAMRRIAVTPEKRKVFLDNNPVLATKLPNLEEFTKKNQRFALINQNKLKMRNKKRNRSSRWVAPYQLPGSYVAPYQLPGSYAAPYQLPRSYAAANRMPMSNLYNSPLVYIPDNTYYQPSQMMSTKSPNDYGATYTTSMEPQQSVNLNFNVNVASPTVPLPNNGFQPEQVYQPQGQLPEQVYQQQQWQHVANTTNNNAPQLTNVTEGTVTANDNLAIEWLINLNNEN